MLPKMYTVSHKRGLNPSLHLKYPFIISDLLTKININLAKDNLENVQMRFLVSPIITLGSATA